LLILVFIMGITVPGILSTCFYNHALNVMEDDSEKVQENAEEEVSTDEEDSNFAEESEEETVE